MGTLLGIGEDGSKSAGADGSCDGVDHRREEKLPTGFEQRWWWFLSYRHAGGALWVSCLCGVLRRRGWKEDSSAEVWARLFGLAQAVGTERSAAVRFTAPAEARLANGQQSPNYLDGRQR